MALSSAFRSFGRSSVSSATDPRASRRTRSIACTSLRSVPAGSTRRAAPGDRRASGPCDPPALRSRRDVGAQAREPHALDLPAAALLHVFLVVVAVSPERELRELDVVEHRP